MKKFKFALAGYLKVKKAKEQEKLGELAKVMRKVNVFREQQQAFESQYSTMLQAQRNDFVAKSVPITQLKDMYDYLGALRLRKDTATRHIAEMEGEVAEKRNAYNAARKDRRVVEIIREKKWSEYKLEAEKEELKFLDEINQARQGHT
ncbi:MAG: flagellar export protein FliJ [Turneriella sp.]|nr:flagellar export protein FliJ [Turneriella sp.]